MHHAESQSEPSTRQRRMLGVATAFAGGVLGLFAFFEPGALWFLGALFSVAWGTYVAVHRREGAAGARLGLAPPGTLALVALAAELSSQPFAAGAFAACFAAIGVAVCFRQGWGNRWYAGWTAAMLPMGWAVSTFLLIVVYYGVFTPLGMLLRLLRRDPLEQSFDADANTYWVRRESAPSDDQDRFFRQY